MATFDIDTIRKDFPVLAQQVNGKSLVYLDSGATSLKPQSVVDAVHHYYSEGTANIHRALHRLSEQATEKYEAGRAAIQRYINAKEDAEVILTSGTTGSINLVAQALGLGLVEAGDEILISTMEHHSNIVPWQLLAERTGAVLKVIPIHDDGSLDMDAFDELISERTKLVSMVWVSNSLGTINPIESIIAKAHAVNAWVLVDGAQAMLHTSIDVQALDIDLLALSGHKMLGPTGTGVLYGKREILEQFAPVNGGGDMIDRVSFEKTTYAELPSRLEPGTPHIAGVIGMLPAVEYLEGLDWDALHAHEADLLAYGHETLGQIEGLRMIGTAENKTGILSFVIDGIHPHDIGAFLDQEGVAVRTGHHCCQPVMERFGVSATVRASLAFYNSREDIDRLAAALKSAQDIFA